MSYFTFPELEHIHGKMTEFHARNSYGLISGLKECFKPQTDKHGRWYRISTSGELGLCDYNAGLHDVRISVQAHDYDQKTKAFVGWVIRFSIGTLDDGSWGAWSKVYETREEAQSVVDKMAPILDDLVTLPTEEKLNEMLRPFGLYGEFEG